MVSQNIQISGDKSGRAVEGDGIGMGAYSIKQVFYLGFAFLLFFGWFGGDIGALRVLGVCVE